MQQTQRSSREIKTNSKQNEALNALFNDDAIDTVVFGGAWRSGKTYVLAFFALLSIMKAKKVRVLVCRNHFTDLRDTTINTFLEVIDKYELNDYVTVNKSPYKITSNETGSEIIFRGVDGNDSNVFRGLSLTHVCIDEANELAEATVKQAYGRLSYGHSEHGQKSKVLLATNPDKGWLYRSVFIPHEKGELASNIKFINSNMYDNEDFLPADYIRQMTSGDLPEDQFQYYVMANWHYVVGSNDLVKEKDIYDICYLPAFPYTKKYMTVDPAGGGENADRPAISIWYGNNVHKIDIDKISSTNELVERIKRYMSQHSIPPSCVAIETNGLGLAIADQIRGCIKYVPNSTNVNGFDKQFYATLKDQLYHKLSQYILDKKITIQDHNYIDQIVQEIAAHKKIDQDGKFRVTPKPQVKKAINRSLDISDTMALRMLFEIIKTDATVISWTF